MRNAAPLQSVTQNTTKRYRAKKLTAKVIHCTD